MGGFNWSTTSSNTGPGESSVLVPSTSSSRSSYYNNDYYNNNVNSSNFNFNSSNYGVGNFNNFLNDMYKENRNYNKVNSENAYKTNYRFFTRLFNEIYNKYEKYQNYYTSLANSAVQRQVKDMIKAGINPILAGRYGGAQTPILNFPTISNYPQLSYARETMPNYLNEQLDLYEIAINYFLKLMGFQNDYNIALGHDNTNKYVAQLYDATDRLIANNNIRDEIEDFWREQSFYDSKKEYQDEIDKLTKEIDDLKNGDKDKSDFWYKFGNIVSKIPSSLYFLLRILTFN